MEENDHPQFDFVLKTVKAAEDGGRQTIYVTASSDEIDLGNDQFALSALKQMEAAFINKTIFLNHHYQVPQDVFGKVTSSQIVARDGHHDLDLSIEVTSHNDLAQAAYNMVKEGVVLGVSVGVLVLDAAFVDSSGERVLNIKSVYTLEASIVGIPANQRSWVRGALKAASALFTGDARVLLEKMMSNKEATVADEEVVENNDNAEGAPAPVSSAEPATDDTTVVVVVVEDDDDDEPDEPMMAEPSERRAETVDALRRAYLDPNRKWFSIKEATIEAEGQPDTVAEVAIYDSIGSGITAQDFVAEISKITASRINLRINSPGGIIDDGIAIRNALARHPADVYTYVDGLAASMASVIALVGKEVIMEPDSMLMIHEPSGCQMGDAASMEREARILNKYATNIAGAYARKAGGTRDEWRSIMRDEGWYTPEEAVDAGLADRVGDAANEEVKQKTFDPRILTLFKKAPASASRFFKAEAPAPSTHAVEEKPETDAGDATILAALNSVDQLKSALLAANAEVDTIRAAKATSEETAAKDIELRNDLIAALTLEVNKVLDSPLPRKIMPEENIMALAEKFRGFGLDDRVLAHLARQEHGNA